MPSAGAASLVSGPPAGHVYLIGMEPYRDAVMIRPLAVALLAALLAGCAGTGTGSRDWSGGGSRGVYWSGPYGGYGSPGGYWGGRNYGYWDDDYRRPVYRRQRGRTFRPDRDVVCDRATDTCYRDGEIDASETRDNFGTRAARRVDRIRDRAGTNSIFRPDDDVVCNYRRRACQKDGRFDRSETRDFFGKKAARRQGAYADSD